MSILKHFFQITALHKKAPVNARDLLSNLLLDSELARKREKRSQISPVHRFVSYLFQWERLEYFRYLHLVKDLPLLPCTIDAEGLVISLAPLTNSDLTKVSITTVTTIFLFSFQLSESTTDVLVEVSSQESIETCRAVMEAIIQETLSICPTMHIHQVL